MSEGSNFEQFEVKDSVDFEAFERETLGIFRKHSASKHYHFFLQRVFEEIIKDPDMLSAEAKDVEEHVNKIFASKLQLKPKNKSEKKIYDGDDDPDYMLDGCDIAQQMKGGGRKDKTSAAAAGSSEPVKELLTEEELTAMEEAQRRKEEEEDARLLAEETALRAKEDERAKFREEMEKKKAANVRVEAAADPSALGFVAFKREEDDFGFGGGKGGKGAKGKGGKKK